MSDQCSVNGVFNCDLKVVREELLPEVVQHCDTLTEQEITSRGDMGNYFCETHLLVNMATECNKVLAELATS